MTRVIGTAARVFYGARIEIGADGQVAAPGNVGMEVNERVHERMNRDGISYAKAMTLVLNDDRALKEKYARWTPNGGAQ